MLKAHEELLYPSCSNHQPAAWDLFPEEIFNPQKNKHITYSAVSPHHSAFVWLRAVQSVRMGMTSFGSSNNFIASAIAVTFACEKTGKQGNLVLFMLTQPVRDRAKDSHLVFPLSNL